MKTSRTKATVKIPQYYYGGIDDERQNFALLMQDMTPAVVGDDIGSCTKAEAILAVREIPKLHAPWWENPALDTFEWLPVGEPNLAVADARFAKEVLPGVMRIYGDTLSPKVRGIIRALLLQLHRDHPQDVHHPANAYA